MFWLQKKFELIPILYKMDFFCSMLHAICSMLYAFCPMTNASIEIVTAYKKYGKLCYK